MAKEAVFVITLSPAPTVPVTLNYATRDGTATAASGDYTSKSGSILFAPGETSKEIVVPVTIPLPVGRPTELFYLDVAWPTGSVNSVTRGTGICTLPGGGTIIIPILTISNVLVA
jgi:hypothetical protein